MAHTLSKFCAIICALLSFVAVEIVIIWLGVAFLVPQYPFHQRNIATGVCLIVFATVFAVISAVIFAGFGFCCGAACESAVDGCCGDCC